MKSIYSNKDHFAMVEVNFTSHMKNLLRKLSQCYTNRETEFKNSACCFEIIASGISQVKKQFYICSLSRVWQPDRPIHWKAPNLQVELPRTITYQKIRENYKIKFILRGWGLKNRKSLNRRKRNYCESWLSKVTNKMWGAEMRGFNHK